jgi:hypothetical protein
LGDGGDWEIGRLGDGGDWEIGRLGDGGDWGDWGELSSLCRPFRSPF